MKTVKYLLLSFAVLTLSLGCKKKCHDPCKPECENYDPCCGRMPADARFSMFERLGYTPKPDDFFTSLFEVDTDTIFNYNFVTFRADYDAEYYSWKAGTDAREWNTKEFTLRFLSAPLYQPIPITLKVYKPARESCNPNAEDTAVFTRYLVTVPYDSLPVWGRYEGKLSKNPHMSDFFELWQEDNTTHFAGLLPRCNTSLKNGAGVFLGFKTFLFYGSSTIQGCCLNILANGRLEKDNIIVNFQYGKPRSHPEHGENCAREIPTIWLNDSFNGKKIEQ